MFNVEFWLEVNNVVYTKSGRLPFVPPLGIAISLCDMTHDLHVVDEVVWDLESESLAIHFKDEIFEQKSNEEIESTLTEYGWNKAD